MTAIVRKNNIIVVLICLSSLILSISGCQFHRSLSPGERKLPTVGGKTIVLGFMPALSQGKESGVIRSPFSGAVFLADPVPSDVTDKMTDKLFALLKGSEQYELISHGKAKGVSSSLMSSDQGMSDMETFRKIGQALSAESVMLGYIYRWKEREGADYSVDRPASVAFDLYIIRSEDGSILWKRKFDKTQAPLSENVFDVSTFFKGKGRWMTVEELADMGLGEMFDK